MKSFAARSPTARLSVDPASAAATSPERIPPEYGPTLGSDEAHCLLVGTNQYVASIAHALRRAGLAVQCYDSLDGARRAATESTRAIGLLEDDDHLSEVVEVLRVRTDTNRTEGNDGWARDTKLFVVVHDGFHDAEARRLYYAGADAVFEWPNEALLMPAIVRDIVREDSAQLGRTGDEALAQLARMRVDKLGLLPDEVDISVHQGHAQLQSRDNGHQPPQQPPSSLSQLTHTLLRVPGISDVETRSGQCSKPPPDSPSSPT